MPDSGAIGEVVLHVITPDAPTRSVRIGECPFLIGRSGANQLQLSDSRISRSAAEISFEDQYYLEDCGQRGGIHVNGQKVSKHALTISFHE